MLFLSEVEMEITDEMIKRKHKEFNDRVTAALARKSGGVGNEFSPALQRLRQLVQLRKPTLERPYGAS